MDRWYEIDNPEAADSPALLIYPARALNNIRRALEISNGPALLRPHAKTHKMREITKMMLAEGIRKFKCATIAEAEMLAASGARDVLLAYQPTAVKARRLRELTRRYPGVRFSCLIDNAGTARMLSQQFENSSLEVFIDLNTGMDRTGISPAGAPELYRLARGLKNISVAGLHAYDGHIHDSDLPVRTQKADETFRLTSQALRKIERTQKTGTTQKTEELRDTDSQFTVIIGGTPTFPVHARRENVETSPGTFVFWDEGYRKMLPDLPFECAALLLTRVISTIDRHTLCLDLGHKSVAAENPLHKRVYFLNEPAAEVLSQSEEHLVVRVPETKIHAVGDLWYGVPHHVCPTVALYEQAQVVKNGHIAETWKVAARNREFS